MPLSVVIEERGPLRLVTLANPTKRNALDRVMLAELVRSLQVSDDVRCVVLRGDPAGAAFSAGYDIARIDEAEKEQGLDPIQIAADALEACPVPVIAAIQGACMGGALELAMACTLRVAANNAKLAMPPAKLGLVYSAQGLARFLRAVSPGFAQRMFLTGEPCTGAQAHAHGLVDVLVDDDELMLAEALRIAHVIASNAPLAVRGLLDALRRLSRPGGPSAEDLSAIAAARARTVASEDLAEGVRAFLQKRPPVFRGLICVTSANFCLSILFSCTRVRNC